MLVLSASSAIPTEKGMNLALDLVTQREAPGLAANNTEYTLVRIYILILLVVVTRSVLMGTECLYSILGELPQFPLPTLLLVSCVKREVKEKLKCNTQCIKTLLCQCCIMSNQTRSNKKFKIKYFFI